MGISLEPSATTGLSLGNHSASAVRCLQLHLPSRATDLPKRFVSERSQYKLMVKLHRYPGIPEVCDMFSDVISKL